MQYGKESAQDYLRRFVRSKIHFLSFFAALAEIFVAGYYRWQMLGEQRKADLKKIALFSYESNLDFTLLLKKQ